MKVYTCMAHGIRAPGGCLNKATYFYISLNNTEDQRVLWVCNRHVLPHSNYWTMCSSFEEAMLELTKRCL